MSTTDLHDLLIRARDRDAGAYGQVVERLQDMAVGYAYAVAGDFHQAQDAAQEAFIEAYACLPRLQSLEGFPGLLRRMVFKHCDRQRRRASAYRFVPLETGLAGGAEADADGRLEQEEARRQVRQALLGLPAAQRQVVSLHYMGGRPQKEVAAFLGVTVDTVKNRLRAARRRLKERLRDMVEENLQQSKPSRDPGFAAGVRRIIAPDPGRDPGAIYDLLADRVGRPDMARAAEKGRIVGSHYDWSASRVALAGDRVAAHIGVYRIDLRLGRGRLRVAGINVAYVDPDGPEGLFGQTAAAVFDGLESRGYDLVLARDNDDDYAAHGFVPLMPFSRVYRVKTADLPAEEPGARLRDVPLNDLHSYPGVAELYNAENDGVPCSARRPTYPHGKNPVEDGAYGPALVLEDDEGGLVGYLADPIAWQAQKYDEIEVTDSAGDPEERLKVLARYARQYGCGHVSFFNLPHQSAMARRLRRMDHTYDAKNERTGGHIPGRLVNLRSALENMAPDLSDRLRASDRADWSGALLLRADDQAACLRVEKGAVSVHGAQDTGHRIEGGQAIAQLVLGTAPAAETIAAAGIRTHGDGAPLAAVLFPPLNPILPNEYL